MRIKSILIPALALGLILILVSSSILAAQGKKKETQEQKVIIIPKEVKALFEEGVKTRQPRMDIPFTIFKLLYFPQQNYMHSVFVLQIKNSDLGYAPLTPEGVKPEKKKEEKTESIFESVPTRLQSQAHVFLQFTQLDGEFTKEIYLPVRIEIDGASYEPEKEDLYVCGYPLLPGKYLLSIAVASQKLEKIGTQYFEFTLPQNDPASLELTTTPIFFVKNIEQMPGQDSRVILYKSVFTYAVLKIEPNLLKLFSPGDQLDIFFILLGAQPNETGQFDIEINYEVLKGEEKTIRYAAQNYKSPLISQPLPLKKTVIIKSEEEEKRETRDLEAGTYTLSLDIKDKISGKTLKTTIDFDVKE